MNWSLDTQCFFPKSNFVDIVKNVSKDRDLSRL